jgi:uncharacterized protein (DUF488 family)
LLEVERLPMGYGVQGRRGDVGAPRLPFAGTNLIIWTVGHSTRSFDEFADLLAEHRIELLADVRRFPASRRVPWATKEALARALAILGIAYEHLETLGGYRSPRPNDGNRGWRNNTFRGYADYMASPEFIAALNHLVLRATDARTAIMCAEALPWKCHRTLLSDSLLARGVRVVHILGPGKTQEHRLTPFAKVHGDQLTYPSRKRRA